MTDDVACLNCQRLERALQTERDKIAKAMIFVENAEIEKRVTKAENTRLKRLLAQEEDEAPKLEDAKAVFLYWRLRVSPRARSFKGKRRTAVLERLSDKPKPYDVVDLTNAIDGAKLAARYDAQLELEYICRDPTITDRFLRAYEIGERDLDARMRDGNEAVWEELARDAAAELAGLGRRAAA